MTATAPRLTAPTGAADGELTHRQKMTIISGLLLGIFLAAVDGTIVSTALPTIAGELGHFDRLTWVVTAYFLTSTATTPLFGKVSDLYGRRIVFQFAIVTFLAASVLAGLAQTMNQLVLFRGLQGIGGGGMQALAFVILGDILSPRERGRYMGLFTGTFALSGLAGPLLGGLVVDSGSLGWRWIFYLNLPLGLVTFAVITAVMRFPIRKVQHAIDWLGAGLLVGAVSCLLIGASLGGGKFPWSSPLIVGLFAASLVLGVLTVKQEKRAAEPVLPMRLFSNDVFSWAMAMAFVAGGAFTTLNVFLPLFLQIVTGSTATRSGLLLAPMMLGLTVTSIIAGQVLSKTGRYRALIRSGPFVILAGLGGISMLSVSSKPWHATPWMLVCGIGMGLMMPPLSIAVQNAVDYTDLGVATSANTFFRTLGQTCSVAGFGAVMAARLRTELALRIPAEKLAALDVKTLTGSPRQIKALPADLRIPVVASIAHGVHAVFLGAIPLAVLTVFLAWRIREIPLKSRSGLAQAAAAAE